MSLFLPWQSKYFFITRYFFIFISFVTFEAVCFAGGFTLGTLVKVPLASGGCGYRPIEDLVVGDFVSSYEFGEYPVFSQARITNIVRTKVKSVFKICVGSECLLTSADQYIYSPNLNWLKAKSLSADSALFSAQKGFVDILSKQELFGEFDVVSLTISSNSHAFFVSNKELLVHNSPIEIACEITQLIAPNLPPQIFSLFITLGTLVFTLLKKTLEDDRKAQFRKAESLEKKRRMVRQPGQVRSRSSWRV